MHLLNRYSKALIGVYLPAVCIMEYGSPLSNWKEGIACTLPIIALFLVWSEQLTGQLSKRKPESRKDNFQRDLFVINYAFLFAVFASLLFEGNNVDARGWWPFFVLFSTLYGWGIGLLFSVFALLLNKNHRYYTHGFAIILTFFLMLPNVIPRAAKVFAYSGTDLFYSSLILLLGIHLLVCLGSYLVREKPKIQITYNWRKKNE
ncbi:MAG: hypothetical protein H0U57_05920 [Tatlockia sp.]|nr:hypothetical protein [Tatlockia sp.]